MAKELRGPQLLCAAVNQILAHPETWNQSIWHCGSTHCIAGHCEIIAGGPTNDTQRNAQQLLGLSDADASYLFYSRRSLVEIYSFAEAYRYGYNHDGYDHDGYDRGGYDRDGYDRYGYNRYGYNLGGCNRYGYNLGGKRVSLNPFVLDD